jgi:hypothetical protein
VNDIWFHREKEQLWWTRSKADAPTIELGIDPFLVGDQRAYICHKPCGSWSNHTENGNRLEWNILHPKAKEFLFTEGTLQQLDEDNASYAFTLIQGGDLTPWHTQPLWKAKLGLAKAKPGTIFNSRQKTIVRMAARAFGIAAVSNGQEAVGIVKDKRVLFSKIELEKYIGDLLEAQDRLCALTGIPLQFDGEEEDAELLCSLDRIDSDKHYEKDNLQIVCRFANRWKSNSADVDFRRLIGVVRASGDTEK